MAANVAYLGLCAATGMALAGAAFKLQRHLAPALLFPLLIGVAAGGTCFLASSLCGTRRKGVIWTGGMLCASFAAIGQHGFAYREYCRGIANPQPTDPRAQLAQLAAPKFEPIAPLAYLQAEARLGRQFGPWRLHGGWAWGMWASDWTLTLLGAALSLRWLQPRIAFVAPRTG